MKQETRQSEWLVSKMYTFREIVTLGSLVNRIRANDPIRKP